MSWGSCTFPRLLGPLDLATHPWCPESLCQGQSAGHKPVGQGGRREETTAHTFPGGSPGHPLPSRVQWSPTFTPSTSSQKPSWTRVLAPHLLPLQSFDPHSSYCPHIVPTHPCALMMGA